MREEAFSEPEMDADWSRHGHMTEVTKGRTTFFFRAAPGRRRAKRETQQDAVRDVFIFQLQKESFHNFFN